MKSHPHDKLEIKNKKVYHDYNVGEIFEAGVVLLGTEVKSIKLGHAQINESFVRVDRKGSLLLFNAQIDEYSFGNFSNHEPKRQRHLLLHHREIKRVRDAIEKEGSTAIPIKLYLNHGLIKLTFGLCKGKKVYDKRYDLKQRTEMREVERYLAKRYR